MGAGRELDTEPESRQPDVPGWKYPPTFSAGEVAGHKEMCSCCSCRWAWRYRESGIIEKRPIQR